MTNEVSSEVEQTPQEKWSAEIVAAEKALVKFHERARSTTKRFLDERDTLTSPQRWFNVFYANTNILESALYAQLPKPAVSRRFTDYGDDVGRVAALIIERCITQDLDDPTDLFDATMRHCVQDRLVPGLAQAWLRLETDTEPVSVPPTPGSDVDVPDPVSSEAPAQLKIKAQRVIIDYIFWEDFLWSPCRVWEERRWVGRRAYLDRDELVKRFGDKGKLVPLGFVAARASATVGESSTPLDEIVKKARVYEIWDRTTRKVVWFCKEYSEILDEKEDTLGLKGFEPCPRPMLANCSTSNTVPRPDYYMIQDQYLELDSINQRITMLVRACKVVGVYDKGAVGISRMLTEGTDNTLIPVDSWAAFAEGGGVKGKIDWLPLEQIIATLRELNSAREIIKGQIYELTGIADIVRGASKASETLGAQQIKAQFASVRIKKLQDEVARFASDIMRIKAEIMVKHFPPEELLRRSNIAVTGNDEYVPAAIQLLTQDDAFEWRIQVNADTLAQADYAMEKQDRIDFLTAVSKFMAQVGPLLQAEPQAKPLLISLLKWTVAGFRGARDIEGTLDKSLQALERQPEQPKPDPEAQKAQAEAAKLQQEAQLEAQRLQQEMQHEQQMAALEAQRVQMEMQAEQQRLAMEMQAEQQRLAMEQQSQQMELMFQRLLGQLKVENARELADIKIETAHESAEAKVDSSASGDSS
tara:strand:+ start:30389 stop:32485 length:2097 start_codon:yes stop_codon:yes gene_type:complete